MSCMYFLLLTMICFLCGCYSEKISGYDFLTELPLDVGIVPWDDVYLTNQNGAMILAVRGGKRKPRSEKITKTKKLIIKYIPRSNHEVQIDSTDFYKQSVNYKIWSLRRCTDEKLIWSKKLDGRCDYPYLIYDNFNLKNIALLFNLPQIHSLILLDPRDGNIVKKLDFNVRLIHPIGNMVCSTNLDFVVMAYAPNMFDSELLVYSLDKGRNVFTFLRSIPLPIKHHDDMAFEDMKLINEILVISLSKGNRYSIIPQQKVVFIDLKNDLIISEISLKSQDKIMNAGITSDKKYLILLITTSQGSILRLYRRHSD